MTPFALYHYVIRHCCHKDSKGKFPLRTEPVAFARFEALTDYFYAHFRHQVPGSNVQTETQRPLNAPNMAKVTLHQWAGRVSPAFTNAKDAMAWLNDPDARFQNGDKVREKV